MKSIKNNHFIKSYAKTAGIMYLLVIIIFMSGDYIISNVHWHSDVEAAKIIGSATVAKLHANPDFIIDLNVAKAEVLKLKKSNLK